MALLLVNIQGAPKYLPRNFTKMGYSFAHPCPDYEIPLKGLCRKVYNFYDD